MKPIKRLNQTPEVFDFPPTFNLYWTACVCKIKVNLYFCSFGRAAELLCIGDLQSIQIFWRHVILIPRFFHSIWISKPEIWNSWWIGGVKKNRRPPKSLLKEIQISISIFMASRPTVAEIFQSGPKWPTWLPRLKRHDIQWSGVPVVMRLIISVGLQWKSLRSIGHISRFKGGVDLEAKVSCQKAFILTNQAVACLTVTDGGGLHPDCNCMGCPKSRS